MPQNLRISELTDGGNVRVGDVFPANTGEARRFGCCIPGVGLSSVTPQMNLSGPPLPLAERPRSTYFTTTSTTAFQDFIANRFLAIVLNPTNSTDNVFETYTGSGSTYDDTMWVERTGTAQGIPGARWGAGAFFRIRLHQCRNRAHGGADRRNVRSEYRHTHIAHRLYGPAVNPRIRFKDICYRSGDQSRR